MRTTQRLGDLLIETPSGWIPARQIADIKETDGPEPDPARKRPAAGRRARQHRRQRRHGDDRRGDPARAAARPSCRKATSRSLEGTFQAQEQASRTIGMLSLLSLSLIFAILYSRYRSAALALIIMGSVPLGADRFGRGALDRGPAALGRQHDRLHHADRHRGAQRHPEDQPLHQPVAARRRAVRAASWSSAAVWSG